LLELLASRATIERSKKIEVKAIKRVNSYVAGITSSLSDVGEIHVCSLDGSTGTRTCSCWGAHKSFCSHLVATLETLPVEEKEDLIRKYVDSVSKGVVLNEEILKELDFIPTSLKAFNTQTGGLARRTLTNICGEAGAGKSILLTQLCWEFLSKNTNKNVLYIGTEGGEEYIIKGWALKAFNKRYGFTPNIVIVKNLNLDYKKEKEQSIFVFNEPKLLNILEQHGFPLNLKVSEEGKMSVRLNLQPVKKEKFAEFPKLENSPVGRFITKHDIGMIIYDSISMPNEIFISGQVNFPGRDDAQGLWFAQMQDAAMTHDIVVLGSTHITKDDTNKFDMGKPIGGKTVHHNFKIVARVARYLNPRSKNPAQNPNLINKRQFVRERFFFERTGRQAGITVLDLTDEGYTDVDIVPVEETEEE